MYREDARRASLDPTRHNHRPPKMWSVEELQLLEAAALRIYQGTLTNAKAARELQPQMKGRSEATLSRKLYVLTTKIKRQSTHLSPIVVILLLMMLCLQGCGAVYEAFTGNSSPERIEKLNALAEANAGKYNRPVMGQVEANYAYRRDYEEPTYPSAYRYHSEHNRPHRLLDERN